MACVSITNLSSQQGIYVLAKGIVIVGADISGVGTVGDQRGLGLGSLGLLASLVRSFLLLHLLVAQGSQSAGNLLDLVAGKVL